MDEALRKLRDSVTFAKFILGFEPFPYQEKLLREPSKRVIAICGRQIGKSSCAAVKLLNFAVSHPKTTSIIVSATLRQSMETFDKVLGFVQGSMLRRSIVRATRTLIRFTNGSRILCLPSGRYGSTLRGLTVHFAVLDEAAFIPEEVITQAVFPMLLTTNGSLWMLTTPWDRGHITYRCLTSPEWSVYRLPSRINPLVTEAFLEEQKRLIGLERFAMEYEGQFIDDAKAYFPMTLLRSCLPDEEEGDGKTRHVMELHRDMELYAGYDPGGRESQAALVVVSRDRERERSKDDKEPGAEMEALKVRFLKAELGKPYTQFTVEVADLHRQTPFQALFIDATGLGEPVVEHTKELGLPAEGLKLTAPVKEQLFANLKLLMEQRKVVIPDSPELLNALNCIEYERTRTGGYTFSHRSGAYDDLAYALALACWAAKERRARPPGVVMGV